MSSVKNTQSEQNLRELRDAFDDELVEAEERPDLSRRCPNCGGRGVPDARFHELLDCPDNDCRTKYFSIYRR